jgi:hypothetical protein
MRSLATHLSHSLPDTEIEENFFAASKDLETGNQ